MSYLTLPTPRTLIGAAAGGGSAVAMGLIQPGQDIERFKKSMNLAGREEILASGA